MWGRVVQHAGSSMHSTTSAAAARVTTDWQLGPRTRASYRAPERKRGRIKACELTLKLLDAQQASRYMQLNQFSFLVGWVDHRVGNVALARCAESVATSTDQS